MLQSLQTSGESYDRAREVLKHVSVDSSGKVELEDWVEVRTLSLILVRQGVRILIPCGPSLSST